MRAWCLQRALAESLGRHRTLAQMLEVIKLAGSVHSSEGSSRPDAEWHHIDENEMFGVVVHPDVLTLLAENKVAAMGRFFRFDLSSPEIVDADDRFDLLISAMVTRKGSGVKATVLREVQEAAERVASNGPLNASRRSWQQEAVALSH